MTHPVGHNYLVYKWLLYISHPINVHSNHLTMEDISILWQGSSCCSAHSKTNWILLAPMQPFTRSAVVAGAAVWVTCVPHCYQPSCLDEFLIAGQGLPIIRLRLAQLSSSVSQLRSTTSMHSIMWYNIYWISRFTSAVHCQTDNVPRVSISCSVLCRVTDRIMRN